MRDKGLPGCDPFAVDPSARSFRSLHIPVDLVSLDPGLARAYVSGLLENSDL